MVDNFVIISDSSCELSLEAAKENDVVIVPFEVTFDGEKYFRENIDMRIEDFYHILRTQNVYPKTSLPSIQVYSDVFRQALSNGRDLICFCITSRFSGSYQSACNAKKMVQIDYPDRKIIIVDSYLCTATQGALVLEAARMRRDGLPIEAVFEKCEKMKTMSKVYTTVDSLTYLQKGGRIGKVSAFAGGLLKIKPIIVFTNGELNPHSKVRGRKKALQECMDLINKDILDEKYKYITTYMHADELNDITEIRNIMTGEYGHESPYPASYLGVTIGSHIGPTAIAIGYMIKYEYV